MRFEAFFFFLISFFNKVSLLSALIESVFDICCELAIEMIKFMVFDFLYFHPDKLSGSGVGECLFPLLLLCPFLVYLTVWSVTVHEGKMDFEIYMEVLSLKVSVSQYFITTLCTYLVDLSPADSFPITQTVSFLFCFSSPCATVGG